MTTGKKLYLGSAIAFFATVLLGGTAWFALENIGSLVSRLVNVDAKEVALTGDLRAATSDMVAAERAVLFAGSRHNAPAMERASDEFSTSMDRLSADLKTLEPLIESKEALQMVAEIRGAFDELASNHRSLAAAASGSDIEAANKLLETRVLPAMSRISSRAENMKKVQSGSLQRASASAIGTISANRWVNSTLLLFSLVTGTALFFIIRVLNASMAKSVGEIATSADQVNAASAQVAAASQRLAQASCQQAASLEETSASTEEIGSMTRRNSENSKAAAELVDKSVQGFIKSNRLLDEMLSAMEQISDSSDKISRIIKVIDEIAFQTNILALNAAVEAARAGEAGMGFAVVADEVRNLAQRCAQAAKDTEALIQDSIAKSRDGKSKVNETANSIRMVSDQAGQIKTLIDEVTLGSVEQTRGVEQISKALSQMDQTTQSNAANAEQSAAASQELQSQAITLRASIDRICALFTESQGGLQYGMQSASPAQVAPVGKAAMRTFSSSVSALSKATGHSKTSATQRDRKPSPATVVSGMASRDEFPLEESFTEF